MTPQELKNSVLLYAVQGKLSKQDGREKVSVPNDCWSNNEEEPFSIPPNWIWKRFGFFAELRMGKTILKAQLCDKGIPVYSATQSDDVLGHIQSVELELHRNDLVIPARGNSIGFVTLVKDEIATCTQTTICAKDLHDILPEYLYYCCYAFKKIWFVFSGSAIPQVTVKQIEQFMVPTPPLSEQKRIVAKIEELLPLIDRYEKAWSRLKEFNKRFPDDMQKSILQMAIQGKLVEQRPEEGTGEELYQQIQAEKQKLIKEGKIKKEKPLTEITEDEKPFDIPDSWIWVSIGSVCCNIQYGTSSKSSISGRVAVLRMGNIQNGRIVYDKLVYTSDDDEIYKYPLNKNDLLFNRTNSKELVGKTGIYKGEMPAIYAGYLVRITPVIMDSDFLNYVMQSKYYWNYCQNVRSDAIGQSNINAEKLKRFCFPLPPLAEQHRIVAKLEELLPLCEKLR